jgi:hypothetical protein
MRCSQPGWWIQVSALHTFQTPPQRVFAYGGRFYDLFGTDSRARNFMFGADGQQK